MNRGCVTLATALCVTLVTAPAAAQKLQVGWGLGVATGLERGEQLGATQFRRARSRVVVPIDLRVDEDPNEAVGIVVFAEVEPRSGLGAELRYLHTFGRSFVGFVGATSVITPHTLAGVDFGFQLHLPVSGSASIYLEPSLSVIPFGTDLPSDRLILWGLLTLGCHAN